MLAPRDFQHLVILVLSLLEALNIVAKPSEGSPLSDYISYYEPLFYNHNVLHAAHHRMRRSTQDQVLSLDLQAHGRQFRLRLRRDTGVFSQDVIMENSSGRVYYDTGRAYAGHLAGEAGSHVRGVVTSDGVFEGSVQTPLEQYVIEKADRYFTDKKPFHSVIYKRSDVRMDRLKDSLCKSDELHRKLRQWQREEFLNNSIINKNNRDPWISRSRQRRTLDPMKTTCTLYLQADHLFYESLDSNEDRVIEQLTQHIQGVNEIYNTIDFDKDGSPDSINFIIKRITVHTNPARKDYKYANTYGVESFLERFSENNFNPYCLAYMFTYRDFEGGTLGLAWTGDLTNAGGVCEKYGQFRGSSKSLNTGIVTVLNYGKGVPSCVSHVTLAHELGHNMGSQHDPETTDCSPGGEEGNYIMYARATSGNKPNNNEFSHCSQVAMSQIMAAKARGVNGCFTKPLMSLCGNGVVEGDEECDCGYDEECEDKCCYPQTESEQDRQGQPCTLRRENGFKKRCSPTAGPCCSEQCEFIGSDEHHICRQDSDCQYAAICNGTSAHCPNSRNRPDKLLCDDKKSVCHNGECTSSICAAYGLRSCQCQPIQEGDFNDVQLCTVCCKQEADNAPCISSFHWNWKPYDVPDLMTQPGAPCYSYKGYCDEFHKCLEVEDKGALSNLRSMLFSGQGLHSLREWLAKHWYVAAAGGIGLISFVVVFIKVCHSKKKAAQQSLETSSNISSPKSPLRCPDPPDRTTIIQAPMGYRSATVNFLKKSLPTDV